MSNMFEVKCGRKECENKVYAYAKDRAGNLPTVYCSKTCEGQVNYAKRFKKL